MRELASLLGEIFTPSTVANRLAEHQEPYDAGTQELPMPAPSPIAGG